MTNELETSGATAQDATATAISSQEKAFLNELMSTTFNSVTRIEEKSLTNRLLQGLTIAEIHTLAAVGLHGSVPMKTIAANLEVTLATVNASVGKLEKKGYLTRVRSETDRRQMLVSLTNSGRKAVRVHDAFHRKMVDRALEGLTAEEEAALVKALTNVKSFFDEEYASAE